MESRLWTQEEVEDAEDGNEDLQVGGEITRVTRKKTRTGNPFANVTVVFGRSQYNLKFWADKLAKYNRLLQEGRVVMCAGTKDNWNNFDSVVVGFLCDIEDPRLHKDIREFKKEEDARSA